MIGQQKRNRGAPRCQAQRGGGAGGAGGAPELKAPRPPQGPGCRRLPDSTLPGLSATGSPRWRGAVDRGWSSRPRTPGRVPGA